MKHDRNKKFTEEEEKISKPTYQAVLHGDSFDTIIDRVCNSMSELITTFKTVQEALKQKIEAQLTALKTLVSHAP